LRGPGAGTMYLEMSTHSRIGMSELDPHVERVQYLRAVLKAVPNGVGLGQLAALLAVAAEAGLSVNDLSDRIDAPQQTASRYVAQLIGRYQDDFGQNQPIPLVEQRVSVADPRKRALYLTPHGREVVKAIIAAGWGA
jgi:DNA-binding MarR family transcriptional regulator